MKIVPVFNILAFTRQATGATLCTKSPLMSDAVCPKAHLLRENPNLGQSQDWVKCCKFGLILFKSLSLEILLFGFGRVRSCVIKWYHFKAFLAEFFFGFHLSYW